MNRIFSNLILGFFIIMLFAVYAIANQDGPTSNKQVATTQEEDKREVQSEKAEGSRVVFPNGKVILVEVADDEIERVQGLSGRTTMNADAGMLFVFPSLENQVIWMKDMKFDIDIVWIDDSGKVVHIERNAKKPEPGQLDADLPLYASMEPTTYILEVPAGVTQIERLKIGDKVEIKL